MGKKTTLHEALELVGLTDTGLLREHNEDAIGFDNDLGFVILADGMGGYNAGEVASSIAIEEISRGLSDVISGTPLHAPQGETPWPMAHHILRNAIDMANAVIYTTARRDPRFAGMGTTLATGLFYDNRLLLAHVGDSRVYRYRDGVLAQLTRDHSLVQEQLDAGLIQPEEADESEFRNLVTRALGVESSVLAEMQEFHTLPNDLYLFCSDGLTDMLGTASIAAILAEQGNGLMSVACSLIEQANAAGGRDNISVILARVKKSFRANTSVLSRLAGWLR